jgi:hypothetical protein
MTTLMRSHGGIRWPERSELRGVWGAGPPGKNVMRMPVRSEPRGVWGAGPPGKMDEQNENSYEFQAHFPDERDEFWGRE